MDISNDAWPETHAPFPETGVLGEGLPSEGFGLLVPSDGGADAPADRGSFGPDAAVTSPVVTPVEIDAPTSLVGAFSLLRQQLTGVTPTLRDLRGEDRKQLVAIAGEIEHVARLVAASQVMIAGAITQACAVPDASGKTLASTLGCRNAIEVLQRATRASGRDIAARSKLATQLTEDVSFTGAPLPAKAPAVAEALLAGDLSAGCATQIVTSLERGGRVAPPQMVANAEHLLVKAATTGLNEQILDGFDLATSSPEDLDVAGAGDNAGSGDGAGSGGGTADGGGAAGSGEPGETGMPEGAPGDTGQPDGSGVGIGEGVAPAGGDSPFGGSAGLAFHDDEMRGFCQAIEVRLDQEGEEPVNRDCEAQRGFRFGRTKDGLVRVTGVLTAETAALLQRVLEPILTPRRKPSFKPIPGTASAASDSAGATAVSSSPHSSHATLAGTDSSTGTDRSRGKGSGNDADDVAHCTRDAGSGAHTGSADNPGDDDHDDRHGGVEVPRDAAELAEHPMLDRRTADQKRHDALATVLQMCAKHPDMPTSGGAPVSVLIQVAEKDLREDHGVGWVHGHDGDLSPVPMQDVRHAVCSGEVLRVTQDNAGRIVNLGIPSRIFNANQRRAITLRDGGCVIPGCTIPATWCEIHHVKEWQNGGETHTDNGVLVCWYHHRSLDDSGWEIRMSGGLPEVRPPGWIDADRYWYRAGSILRRTERALTA